MRKGSSGTIFTLAGVLGILTFFLFRGSGKENASEQVARGVGFHWKIQWFIKGRGVSDPSKWWGGVHRGAVRVSQGGVSKTKYFSGAEIPSKSRASAVLWLPSDLLP